jgi:hypothetical protein
MFSFMKRSVNPLPLQQIHKSEYETFMDAKIAVL